jgi:hypothetical protein
MSSNARRNRDLLDADHEGLPPNDPRQLALYARSGCAGAKDYKGNEIGTGLKFMTGQFPASQDSCQGRPGKFFRKIPDLCYS